MANKFITYRSSAGSGKTYTLVKEFLKLALHTKSPSYYKRILAITFTNKAAAEMKERVIKQLITFSKAKKQGVYNSDLLDKNDRELLKSLVKEINATYSFADVDEETLLHRADKSITHILHNYSDLSISTIDSFVHGIIRNFAREMNLDTEFEVALDQKKVLQSSIKELLLDVGKEKDLTKILLNFVSTKIEDSKGWDIQGDLEKFGQIIFKDSAQTELKKLNKISSIEFLQIRKKLKESTASFELQFAEYELTFQNLIQKAGLIEDDFSRKTIPDFFNNLTANVQKQADYYPNATLQKMMDEEDGFLPKKKEAKIPLLLPIKKDLIKLYNAVVEKLESEEIKIYRRRKLILKHFFGNALLNNINRYTDSWKEDNNIVMVSDFNRKISEIVLKNPAPFIYEKIGEHYLHILIDEFQDTALLQWQNFLPLIENSLSKGKFNMVVGDAKQAIYRWRDGEVMQFVKLPKIYKPLSDHIATITTILEHNHEDKKLETNYRSSNEVIAFNNQLFEKIAPLLGEYQDIYHGLKQEIGKNKTGLVTIDNYTGQKAADKEEEQFRFIIQKITDALDDGYSQKDIVLLFRSNKEGKIIAEKLLDKSSVAKCNNSKKASTRSIIDQGLSVLTSESLLLQANVRIQVLINLAKITLNAADEKSKVNLVSNLSKLGLLPQGIHETLQEYRTVAREKGKREKTTFNFPTFMKNHFPTYFDTNYNTLGIYEIVESFIRLFSFEVQVDNYLEYFLHTVMNDPTISLLDFVNWWDDNKEKISVGESAGSEGIRVMTIHKSKGLQFPVVIVPIKKSTILPSNIWLEKDEEFQLPTALVSIAPSEKNSTISKEIAEEKNKHFLDQINTLYVATTRPEDRLHLILEVPKKPDYNKQEHAYQYIHNAFDSEDIKNKSPWGKRTLKSEKSTLEGNHFTFKSYISKPLNAGIQISYRKGEQWADAEEEQTSEKDYGIIIHELLSKANIKQQLQAEIDQMVQRGLIAESIKEKIANEITQLLKHKQMRKWFDPTTYQHEKSEKELLTSEGKVLRPDKVIFYKDHIDVIDFKSGEMRKTHHEQVLAYVREIKKTTQKTVHGFLVYTKSQKIEPVKDDAQLSMF